MMDTISFNPRQVKLVHMLRAKQAFGVNVMNLMKKIDLAGDDGLDPSVLELEELLTIMFLALDVLGKNPKKDEVLEMNLEELMSAFQSDEVVHAPDPT